METTYGAVELGAGDLGVVLGIDQAPPGLAGLLEQPLVQERLVYIDSRRAVSRAGLGLVQTARPCSAVMAVRSAGAARFGVVDG